jgi:glycerate kinase
LYQARSEEAMKILIAPDSFKESLSAFAVAEEIEAGFREIFPNAEYRKVPVADGGEGTVQAIVDATGGQLRTLYVIGPVGASVQACYGLNAQRGLAVIEMAAASGLELVPASARNPLVTTSFGTGQLIRDALDAGARRFVIGIGGSATNDGGAGMLQALGVRLMDQNGLDIGRGGAELARLAHIDASGIDPRIAQSQIDVACDVINPLIGPNGASAIFGPQKGATPEMVAMLDACLQNFAIVLKQDIGPDLAYVPGTGAAGGMGAAMLGLLGGRLRPGSEVVTDAVGLEAHMHGADLVITGEGRIDAQTAFGKTPIGVARVALRLGIPVIGIGGCLSPDAGEVHSHGIQAVFSTVRRACSVEEALQNARFNLRHTARNVAAALQLGMQLRLGA